MLDTAFRRFVGDIGRADSVDAPVIYQRVPRASARAIVHGDASSWVDPFVEAAHILKRRGATAIVSSCGFLAQIQQQLAASVQPIPLVSSSLLLHQELMLHYQCPAVLTIDAKALQASGLIKGAPIGGIDAHSHFASSIFDDDINRDYRRCEADALEAAKALIASHPIIDALLLECTNLAPHAAAIERAFGLPTMSIMTVVDRWLADCRTLQSQKIGG
ncbi:aspartate/glutamate racemase family protein [Gammaproteobacteria bacterium]|nr:aspartate/glutamate racemase family protein [Gammaproteobacteria bacterium]